MPIKLITSGGGSAIITPTAKATDYTLTVPAVTANVVTTGDTASITGGMIASNTIPRSTFTNPLTVTQNIDLTAAQQFFTNIPSWVTRVTVSLNGVYTNTAGAVFYLRLGTAGGVVSSGYYSYAASVTTGINAAGATTSAFAISMAQSATSGSFKLHLVNSTTHNWSCDGVFGSTTPSVVWQGGSVALNAPLTTLNWATSAGNLSAGTAAVFYE